VSATVTVGGSAYTSEPTVTFSGGGGSGVAVTVVLTLVVVTSIIITNVGTGYTSTPTITFSVGGGTVSTATTVLGTNATTTTAVTPTSVTSLTFTNNGSTYTIVLTVAFTDGDGSGTEGTTVLTPTTIVSIAVSPVGTGYTIVPNVVFSPGTATVTTVLTTTTLSSFTITNDGSGYTSVPTVVLTAGGGSSGGGTSVLGSGSTLGQVIIITATSGSGYTTNPVVSFTGGGGSGVSVSVNLTGTSIASTKIGNEGSYTRVPPTISFTGGGGGVNVPFTTTLTGTTVSSVTITVAVTTVLTSTSIGSITLTTVGTGYTGSPTISFTGGGTPTVTVNTYTPYTLTMDDGFYTVHVLNVRIQQFCITNGMYLTDGSGNNVYYLSITPNSTASTNQIITKLIPTSGTSYTVPSNFAGYSLVTPRCPYIEILSNNFGKYLGFTTGIYGKDQITTYNVLSNIIPIVTTVNTLLVKCSFVSNDCSNQSDILDTFTIGGSSGGTFGGNLNYTNNIEKFV
jgi:hypothetical protein